MDGIRKAIGEFIYANYPLAKTLQVENSQDLMEAGIVDSMGLLVLIDYIEMEFGFHVRDEDLVSDNFSNVESIANYVALSSLK